MKHFLLLVILASCGAASLMSQNPCGQGRFAIESFGVIRTNDVVFGENVQPTFLDPNARQTLRMDVYEPAGDTLSQRPLLILAFGGAFVAGERKAPDVSTLCERMAKAGYVCASIDYRLSIGLIFDRNERNFYLAVIKAVHDMRAAVRYFRRDADSANLFRIHPDLIFAGGISAGGVTAVHLAYLDEVSEWPATVQSDSALIGGIEGLSGNLGYSSTVAGVINLCGAIGDTTWIRGSQVPIISAHGTDDTVVPYGSSDVLLGSDLDVHGSASIHEQALRIGLQSHLRPFHGADHVPFSDGPNIESYMDTTVEFVKENLWPIVCLFSTSSLSATQSVAPVTLWPQPARHALQIKWEDPRAIHAQLFLMDMMGRSLAVNAEQLTDGWYLHRGTLPAGLYIYQIRSATGSVLTSGRLLWED